MQKRDFVFYDKVTAAEFINGKRLANLLGLRAGKEQNKNASWLHYQLNGKECYMASKSLRHSISWESLCDHGLVVNQKTEPKKVVIKGKEYLVRLPIGVTSLPSETDIGFDTDDTHNSEWNIVLYHLHNGINSNKDNVMHSERAYPKLGKEDDNSLNLSENTGLGNASWVNETCSTDPCRAVIRGEKGVSSITNAPIHLANPKYGWRPVLELLQ